MILRALCLQKMLFHNSGGFKFAVRCCYMVWSFHIHVRMLCHGFKASMFLCPGLEVTHSLEDVVLWFWRFHVHVNMLGPCSCEDSVSHLKVPCSCEDPVYGSADFNFMLKFCALVWRFLLHVKMLCHGSGASIFM